jgi:serine/threonine protein kinase
MPTISDKDALPAGFRLGEFEVQRLLGAGGFGIVYLAFDHALERLVAIKEYLPTSLAGRGEGAEVLLRSSAHAETYALGLRSFINEARHLARFDHPSLVKVYRFWEAHGTAYMVMPYYQGRTLHQVRREMAGPPDEAWLRRLITPLLGALECLHREHVYHRDVAPDNILLLDDDTGAGQGRPVLLDLGAARRVIGGHTQALTAIVKPNFAPIEQYAETSLLRQGPWTDLYALASVVHFCITGRPPMPATSRTLHDELRPLSELRAGLARDFDLHFSESFIRAIDHAMAVHPMDRPESVSAWREELSGIVNLAPGDRQALPRAGDDDMLAQTVMVRTVDGVLPPSHQAVDARAYATTTPAAGLLQSQATVPLPRAPRPGAPAASRQAGLDAEWDQPVPTAPVPPAAGAPASHAPPSPASSATLWTRWSIVALLLTAAMAIWWTRPKAVHDTPLALPTAASSTQSAAAASRPERVARMAPVTAASQARSMPNEDRTRSRQAQKEAARESKGDAREPKEAARDEANGPLNPRKACGDRRFIFLAICMKQHCSRRDYAKHPECERMRQQEAAQRGNYP